MTQYIDYTDTTTAQTILDAAIEASTSNDTLTVRCVSEGAHDRLISDLIVTADDTDYCEQPDRATDVWGTHDGSDIRIYIEHG